MRLVVTRLASPRVEQFAASVLIHGELMAYGLGDSVEEAVHACRTSLLRYRDWEPERQA